jgi:sugar lactone lactonase YvrE
MRHFPRLRFCGFVARIAVLCSFSVSCGRTDGAREGSTPVVHNGARGAWKAGERWTLVEVARVGSAVADAPTMFADVVDLALDPFGRVWVADGQLQEIRVFDARGAYVRTIGRKGGGPAEFGAISGMDWAADGRLWVLDGGNARWAVYDTAGALITTHPRSSATTTTPWPGGFDGEGRLYDVGAIPGRDGSFEEVLIRYDTSMASADTFRFPPFWGENFEVRRGTATNRVVTTADVPFTGRQIWGVDWRGHVWIAITDRYRLERHAFRGPAELVVERASRPVRVSRADRDRIVKSYAWFERQGGKVDPSRIPDTYPALDWFFPDDSGHLWVRPASRPGPTSPLDVFDAAGKYLGRVEAPGGLLAIPTPVVRGDFMAALTRDEDDIPIVLLMRLQKPHR